MSALKRLALSDEGFVFDPATGDSYLLNATALALLHSMRASGGREDQSTNGLSDRLVAQLVEKFDVEPETAVADIDDFLLQLRAMRLT